jgi:transcriptional regulator with XRE-family HTH domain
MVKSEQNLATLDEREQYSLRRRADIGQRIRTVRRHKRISQEDVANYLGCSRMKVTRVEKGVSEFSVIELELLARFLDVSILHFLGIELTVSFQGDPHTYVIPQ